MPIIGRFFPETENREAVFVRYNDEPLLEQWQDDLNTGNHHCVIVKRSLSTFVFIIHSSRVILKMTAVFDDDRYCFVAKECESYISLEDAHIEFDEATLLDENFHLNKKYSIEKSFELAVKPEGWKYKNIQCVQTTLNLFDELAPLDSYNAVLEELRRKEDIRLREESENLNAKKQLDVWTDYIKEEKRILEWADKPFKLGNSEPDIKKDMVNIETISKITSPADSFMLEEISSIIGGEINDNTLTMTLEEFKKWQENDSEAIEADIQDEITLKMNVYCDGHWNAKEFKEDYGYGADFYYGIFNRFDKSIQLTYKSKTPNNVFEFYNRVNNSYRFHESEPTSKVKISFSLSVTTIESDDDRKKRIDILSSRKLYSKPNNEGIYLGTLSKRGSDKKNLRIILPQEKEDKKVATDFFKKRSHTSIYPGLVLEKALLDRESDALEKLNHPEKLKNKKLKDFIFNSCRAQAVEKFAGLNSDEIAQTSEYVDCEQTQMLSLNSSQQEAVVKGLFATDLCLLQGPPGTGKTTVISELIWQHIRNDQQQRIMLTSQTNLAIDNALNRLFSNSAIIEGTPSWRNMMLIKPIRIADMDKIEEEGLPFSKGRFDDWVAGKDDEISSNNIVYRWMTHIAKRVEDNDAYADVLSEWKLSLCNPSLYMRGIFARQYKRDSNVLCMTCGKVDSKDFKEYEQGKGFDVVIVDEASKATLPELLMPLCYARKSIIIGDHRQLPPVIFEDDFFQKIRNIDPDLEAKLDKQFKHELVDESLFKRLIMHPNLSPSIKATFNIQYRMHPDINAVISQFYVTDSGGLSCGLNKAKVDAPDFSEKDSRYHGLSLDRFIQPNVHTIWVDVPDGREQGGDGTSSFNEKEVEAVKLVLEALAKSDGFSRYMNYWYNCKNIETRITESKIGIISFYAAQVNRIKRSIQSFCDRNKIKVSTKSVDKFQGQESGIVIVSTVRTKNLGFTRTPERLNVALSRARRLLIIVGNSAFYSSDKAKTEEGQNIYRNVIEKIKDNNNFDVFIDYRELKKLLGY